jgi:hypothetical protein
LAFLEALFAYFVPAGNWLPTKCLIWPIIWKFYQLNSFHFYFI